MPTYSLVTFGCQMNQHDSERVAEVLREMGYEESEGPAAADVVLLNTCSVREKAEHKLRSEVGRIAMLKRDRPELIIGVLGCVAQQEGDRLLRQMPDLDLVVGPDRIGELPAILHAVDSGAPALVRTGFDVDAPEFLAARPEPGRAPVSAFVTVMKGCDERCSFCIVPHTRGPERYRPAREIVAEVARLVSAGVREVTLLGQTVNSYRDPEASFGADHARGSRSERMRSESEFPALLRRIVEEVPALLRLRYTSPHPRHLTDALIRAHAELPPLVRHVHLPVQSGSDRVLRRMIRRYTVEEYETRVARLREAVPGITLSTDVIVGFPGETPEDFRGTLELLERVGYAGVFAFKYSVRPHTPALNFEDDVSEAEKAERLARLFEVSEPRRRAHLTGLVGQVEPVLVEGRSKGGAFTGRTERNEIVHFEAGQTDPTGLLVRLRIERAFKNSLFGALEDGQRLPPLEERRPERRALPMLQAE
ncbi:MAG TPA: tRNA (N6-isopentenyl adenosine(37)-C2)-methylthiotransferase MiaB [Polyangiaceae bacterium]